MALTEVRIREPEVAINVQDHVRKLHGAQEIPALALASHFNRSFMQVDCSCHFFFFFLPAAGNQRSLAYTLLQWLQKGYIAIRRLQK